MTPPDTETVPKRKYIDPAELKEAGFLQEANRLFFHPHGLALEMTHLVEDEGDGLATFKSVCLNEEEQATIEALLAAAHVQLDAGVGIGDDLTPDRLDAVTKRLTEGVSYKPGDCYLSGVWDVRDDPEGIVFGAWDREGAEKANRVHRERIRHHDARTKLFGHPPGPISDVEHVGYMQATDCGGDAA